MPNDYKSLISAARTASLEGDYPELKSLFAELIEAIQTLVRERNAAIGESDDVRAELESIKEHCGARNVSAIENICKDLLARRTA